MVTSLVSNQVCDHFSFLKVWAIDVDENSLYFRNSVDHENPSGIGWKKIQIKCRRNLTNESPSVTENSSQLNTDTTAQDQTVIHEDAPQVDETSYKETKITYFEESIYDNNVIEDIYSIYSDEPHAQTAPNESKDAAIDLNKYVKPNRYSTLVKNVEECPAGFDAFLNKIKEQDETSSSIYDEPAPADDEKPARTASSRSLSIRSDLNQSNTLHEPSLDTWSFKDTNSIRSEISYDPNEFVNISFKVVAANNSLINSSSIQEKWLKKNNLLDKSVTSEFALEDEPLTLLWRTELLNDIKSRNLREYSNIDEISVPYENVRNSFYLNIQISSQSQNPLVWFCSQLGAERMISGSSTTASVWTVRSR